MIILAGIPVACIIVNIVTPDQGIPWWIALGLCLLWVALTIGANHLDGHLMRDAGPGGEYPGGPRDMDNG